MRIENVVLFNTVYHLPEGNGGLCHVWLIKGRFALVSLRGFMVCVCMWNGICMSST